MLIKNHVLRILSYVAIALFLNFFLIKQILEKTEIWWVQILVIICVFGIGIGYVFMGTANVIEETTEVLKDKTKLAGGFLQAFGTAFPDMVIGIMAAILSLQIMDTDYARAINLAIIAAATTFGSNIYNIIHAVWCVYRQNLANLKNQTLLMFPFIKSGGSLKPFKEHRIKPSVKELDTSINILTILTFLTAFSAVGMVIFGRVTDMKDKIDGDLYKIILPIGVILFILCVIVLYLFRKNHHPESPIEEIIVEEQYYRSIGSWRIWLDLILSGIAIMFTAEAMVKTMEVFSNLTHIPFVMTGILAGLIGCFGEMLVVHNFSINPKGRIGDAITGVAMDNIITTLGASVVAIMGGIFLGGSSLILIFIIILTANTLLIQQISKMKNSLQNN